MPVLSSSAFNTAEDVLNRLRVIVNDSEISGGDILTDTAPFTFTLLNGAFERVQVELASAGVEIMKTEAWLIGLPTMPTVDPEGRMIIDDTGTNILYPTGVGNVFSLTPQLPTDLVVPLDLWERQNGTTNSAAKLKQPLGGLLSLEQQLFLVDWEWKNNGIRTRGAMQSQDLKIEYEKKMAQLASPTDPVPIRGVTNAAAYHGAVIFSESRGGVVAPLFKAHADEELLLYRMKSSRRRQRIQTRRRPFSGRGNASYPNLR